MTRLPVALVFSALILFPALDADASSPPDYKEPTRSEMKDLGFKLKMDRYRDTSSIELRFPKQVLGERFTLALHSTDLVVSNFAGEVIARTTNWNEGNGMMSIVTAYNHDVSDVYVSVTYACARKARRGCYGATTFQIASVSKFIDANPDRVNLPPICRNATSTVLDCTDSTKSNRPGSARRGVAKGASSP